LKLNQKKVKGVGIGFVKEKEENNKQKGGKKEKMS